MKIEEGKFYRTRDGRKSGPMSFTLDDLAWVNGRHETAVFRDTGLADVGKELPSDLVAEWTDGPVRTVTRKEIVPGDYGIVNVRIKFGPEVFIARRAASAAELRAAAAVLIELADALPASEASHA